MQPDQRGDFTPWKLDIHPEESGIECDLEEIDITASDLAVLVNATDNVNPEVGKMKSLLSRFNGILEFDFEQTTNKRTNSSSSSTCRRDISGATP